MEWCSENKEYDDLIKCDDTAFMREDLKVDFVYDNVNIYQLHGLHKIAPYGERPGLKTTTTKSISLTPSLIVTSCGGEPLSSNLINDLSPTLKTIPSS